MTNRVAVISGATKGIGHGIAKRLIAGGVAVATIYHRDGEAAAPDQSRMRRLPVSFLCEDDEIQDTENDRP